MKQRLRYTIHDTYDNLPHNPNQLKELLTFLGNELASTRNEGPTDFQLKTKFSRLQQDHHVRSVSYRGAI
jgi:hypothetical protein